MGVRIRRGTMTVGGTAVTGMRDFKYTDKSEYNRDRADDEPVGDEVRMTEGPFDVSFELLGPDASIVSGYIASLVVIGKVITRAAGSESSANKTFTFAQGHFNVGVDVPTENPGRIPVSGEFKTLVIT
jgi:hypothetical protein